MNKLALVVTVTVGLLASGFGTGSMAVGASSPSAVNADSVPAAETTESTPEEETVELTCCLYVLPDHDWRFFVADWQFGVIDYGYGSFLVWNDERLGPIPCSAPKLATGSGLALAILLVGAATLRTRGGGWGGAS